jgi:hypothetical protein
MSNHSSEAGGGRPEDETGPDEEPVGAEVGMTDGDGSTFEPEEDPEGHRD